jgi:hypothetical protein
MSATTIEARVRDLEEEVARLKQCIESGSAPDRRPWWERIYGTFEGSAEYEDAMRLGREYRESLRPEE